MCHFSVLTVLCTAPAAAQVLYGSIAGTVEDPIGAVVPKAKIVLTNKATGAGRDGPAPLWRAHVVLSSFVDTGG